MKTYNWVAVSQIERSVALPMIGLATFVIFLVIEILEHWISAVSDQRNADFNLLVNDGQMQSRAAVITLHVHIHQWLEPKHRIIQHSSRHGLIIRMAIFTCCSSWLTMTKSLFFTASCSGSLPLLVSKQFTSELVHSNSTFLTFAAFMATCRGMSPENVEKVERL